MGNKASGMLLIELLLVISVVGLILLSGMAALNAVWRCFEREGIATHVSAEPKLLEGQLKRAWQRRLDTAEGSVRIEGQSLSNTGEMELLNIGWAYIDAKGVQSRLELVGDTEGGWLLTTGSVVEAYNFHQLGRINLRDSGITEMGFYRTLEFSFPDISGQFDAGFAIHEFW